MPSVPNKHFMLSVIMLNAIMLNVIMLSAIAPSVQWLSDELHKSEWHLSD